MMVPVACEPLSQTGRYAINEHSWINAGYRIYLDVMHLWSLGDHARMIRGCNP